MIWSQKTEKRIKRFTTVTLFSVSVRKGAEVIPQQNSPVYMVFYAEQTEIFDSLFEWFVQNVVIIHYNISYHMKSQKDGEVNLPDPYFCWETDSWGKNNLTVTIVASIIE